MIHVYYPQEFLLKKEKEEQASKKAAGDKGKAYIAKFNEDREKELAKVGSGELSWPGGRFRNLYSSPCNFERGFLG